MTDMTVANTILEQLGGRKFTVMTGAKNFTGKDRSLSFRLPGGGGFCKSGINHVEITLNAADTYDVLFMRIRGHQAKIVAQAWGVYNDQLRDIFTRETGLATSMGRVIMGVD